MTLDWVETFVNVFLQKNGRTLKGKELSQKYHAEIKWALKLRKLWITLFTHNLRKPKILSRLKVKKLVSCHGLSWFIKSNHTQQIWLFKNQGAIEAMLVVWKNTTKNSRVSLHGGTDMFKIRKFNFWWKTK